MIVVGNNIINNAYLGNKKIYSIYLGENNLFTSVPYDSEVEYIACLNDSGAFIDTGFIPDSNTRLVIDYLGVDLTDTAVYVFGTALRKSGALFQVTVASSSNKYTINWNGTSKASSTAIGSRITIDVNKNVTTFGTNELVLSESDFTSTSNLLLLAGTNSSGGSRFSNGTIYSCKIYDNGVLIRDYIPVRVGTEGCLYDKIEDKLYKSASSGLFTAGPDK